MELPTSFDSKQSVLQGPLIFANLFKCQAWLTLTKVPMETVMWRDNKTFAGTSNEETNYAWDSLIPRTYQIRGQSPRWPILLNGRAADKLKLVTVSSSSAIARPRSTICRQVSLLMGATIAIQYQCTIRFIVWYVQHRREA